MTRLRTVELYRDNQRKLMAIEAIALNQTQFNSGGQVNGSITPLVVVVCTSKGNEVVAVDADHTNLDQLKLAHPGLSELLANACRGETSAGIDNDC
jgi:hypothetical protein